MRNFAIAGIAALAIAGSTAVYAQYHPWLRDHMQHMRMSPEDRAGCLNQLGDALMKHADEFFALSQVEWGCVANERMMQIDGAAYMSMHAAQETATVNSSPASANVKQHSATAWSGYIRA